MKKTRLHNSIVPCSGFDSVPSDLGAMLACKQLALKAPDQKCVAVHGVMEVDLIERVAQTA